MAALSSLVEEGIFENRLIHRCQTATTDALEHTREENYAKARADSTEERCDREECDGRQVVILAAKNPG